MSLDSTARNPIGAVIGGIAVALIATATGGLINSFLTEPSITLLVPAISAVLALGVYSMLGLKSTIKSLPVRLFVVGAVWSILFSIVGGITLLGGTGVDTTGLFTQENVMVYAVTGFAFIVANELVTAFIRTRNSF
jgi:hypothetical protein